MMVFFVLQKFFYLLIVDFNTYAIIVLYRQPSTEPMSSRLFFTFFSFRFSVSGFMWMSLIQLNFEQVIDTDLFATFYM